MSKVSVLIPSRNEQFLNATVDDIFSKATGDFEVIVNLDGPPNGAMLKDRPNLHIIHQLQPIGMRPGINACAEIATGNYLMKCDAHCMFKEGFDEVLATECADDWVVVPRRYSLDPENWAKTRKTPKDYHYLDYPFEKRSKGGLHGRVWAARARERRNILIDDEMTSQGSCWFMSSGHFREFLGGLQVEGYGDFIQEFQEIGMKTWLGGGQVKVNKKTWYAHLHKGKRYGRGYRIGQASWNKGKYYSADFWINNRWKDRIHDFEWLIDKFWPVPTWVDDWRERLENYDVGTQ